jgi:hypothetical protein
MWIMTYIADNTLNLNAQALAVLALLSREELPDTLHSETGAWYNGRERGIWIQFRPQGLGQSLNVVVCEGRCTDRIVVQAWYSDGTYMNPPGPDTKGFEEAYQTGRYFEPGAIGEVADYITRFARDMSTNTRKFK